MRTFAAKGAGGHACSCTRERRYSGRQLLAGTHLRPRACSTLTYAAALVIITPAAWGTHTHQVIKFVGCYHGHADSFLVKAGSGVATLGLPDSPGALCGWLGA